MLIKWVHLDNEPDRDKALALRQAFLEGLLSIAVPDLMIHEFSNFLCLRSGLKPALAQKLLENLWSLGLTVFPVDRELSLLALRFASLYGLTAYDAAFVALSSRLQATLVTADRTLHEKTAGKQAVALLSVLVME